MDISQAKRFVFHKCWGKEDKIYISDDIWKIIEINKDLIGVYAVIDTASGEKMIKVEYDYQGEPIIIGGIMGVFLHYDYFINSYPYIEKVYL